MRKLAVGSKQTAVASEFSPDGEHFTEEHGMRKTETDTVVFWDAKGMPIVSITANEIDSDDLVDLFDTEANRAAIEKLSGRAVDNTSEEDYLDSL